MRARIIKSWLFRDYCSEVKFAIVVMHFIFVVFELMTFQMWKFDWKFGNVLNFIGKHEKCFTKLSLRDHDNLIWKKLNWVKFFSYIYFIQYLRSREISLFIVFLIYMQFTLCEWQLIDANIQKKTVIRNTFVEFLESSVKQFYQIHSMQLLPTLNLMENAMSIVRFLKLNFIESDLKNFLKKLVIETTMKKIIRPTW